jgi:hypothetical protein
MMYVMCSSWIAYVLLLVMKVAMRVIHRDPVQSVALRS